FFQIKEKTERFHVQSSLSQPNIRSGSSNNAYPNGINHRGRALVLISTNHWVITGASEVCLACSFVSL
ncbi:hypothetical protein, partial [Vibrio tasmaniensis]|uniref:hypothetical protein n=1 Tax=Vibrio tasmaniensis TaxID=212663 RepID=UPI001A8D5234